MKFKLYYELTPEDPFYNGYFTRKKVTERYIPPSHRIYSPTYDYIADKIKGLYRHLLKRRLERKKNRTINRGTTR